MHRFFDRSEMCEMILNNVQVNVVQVGGWMPSVIAVLDDDPTVFERLEEARANGDVPIVLDHRSSAAARSAAVAAACTANLRGIAWATSTSGSSGAPRVVLRSESSWAESFAAVAELMTHSSPPLCSDAAREVFLPGPASSSMTLFSLAHHLSGGPAARLLRAAGSDGMHGTPESLRRVLESGTAPRLRMALVGGSRLDPGLRRLAEASDVRVAAYYGAAELSFVAVDEGDGLAPFPGVEIEIRQGEVWVRSPFVAAGYAGAAGPLRRHGSWATVGDRGEWVRNSEGAPRLRLLGRADEAILSASATVIPEEVESVLREVAGVRDALVFGLPLEGIGSLVVAMIEPGDDRISLPQLRAAVMRRLAPAHRPRRWFAGPIPRTLSGKPARAEARRRVMDGQAKRLDG
jgi:acyl-CoA synthetase (AMP-forming)/AMP-acid ligase II